jgi:hypothetical protein
VHPSLCGCQNATGSVKSLHLFEARYLSLLDSVLAQPSSNKLFGHVVVEQQGDAFGDAAATFPGAYKGDGFVFLLATVVRVSHGGEGRSKHVGHVA